MAGKNQLTAEQHRALGINLFNATWDLIVKPDRTPDENAEMMDRAHASMPSRAMVKWLCSTANDH